MANQGHSSENWQTADGSDWLELEESNHVNTENITSATALSPTLPSPEAESDQYGVESLSGSRSTPPQGIRRNAAACPELDSPELKVKDNDAHVNNVCIETPRLSMTDDMKRCVLLGLGLGPGLGTSIWLCRWWWS